MPNAIGEPKGAEEALARLRQDRRELHRIPELGLELPETVAYVEAALDGLACRVTHPLPSCVCAIFDFGRPSSIAFRCDMDALPVAERTGAPYASMHPGRMHACGHDGHTATLLELARRLSGLADTVGTDAAPAQNVILVFQPGEEHPGAARDVCETGLLERCHVRRVFGLHLWPEIAEGRVETRPGAFLAQATEVDIHVTGIAAHAAHQERGADALSAACRIALGCAQVAEAERGRGESCVANFGRLEAGTIRNVVAGSAVIEGTVRTFSDSSFERVRKGIIELGEREERRCRGISVDVSFDEGYPPVVNDDAVARRLLDGDFGVELASEPSMIADDFSFYLQRVPGCYLFLGTGRPGCDLHSDVFDFDERVLLRGADLFWSIANADWTPIEEGIA